MHVGQAAGLQRQLGALGAVEQAGMQGGIGMDRHRAVAAVAGRHQRQPAALGRGVEVLLLVAWRDASLRRLDPDLQEVRGAVGGMVELAVLHAGAGAHALHVAGADDARVGRTRGAIAHAVLVGERAVEHVADDLHFAVAMGAEAGAGCDAVFVDDAQVAHTHV
ncbi:hypothetical protein LDC_1093, partial [sediment metagenome]